MRMRVGFVVECKYFSLISSLFSSGQAGKKSKKNNTQATLQATSKKEHRTQLQSVHSKCPLWQVPVHVKCPRESRARSVRRSLTIASCSPFQQVPVRCKCPFQPADTPAGTYCGLTVLTQKNHVGIARRP
jgi:hypothetical protein